MKNAILKLLLVLALAMALVMSFASCDSLLSSVGINTSDSDDNADGEQGGNDIADGDTDNSAESGTNNGGTDDGKNEDENTDKPSGEQPDINGDHEHSFSSWINVKPATCSEFGELARVCMSCGARESQQVEKTEHNYVNGVCSACKDSKYPSGIVDIGKMEAFDYSKIPEYYGAEYVVINGNVPFFTEEEKVTESYELYGDWDSLGRCTVAVSCIGRDLMPTGDRTNTSFQPSGWVQADYSFVPGGKLYNRCHLIAWSLTAEISNRQNLITGTRYMNEAMIPFENMVASYIKETNNHVMYRVTPIFLENNLLASGVHLEAYSVEDEGDGILFNIFFYNVQPDVDIDYKTGASSAVNQDSDTDTIPDDCNYILNTSSKKIHTTTCGNANAISDKNKGYHSGDIEELYEKGYTAAGCCNPS